MPSEKQKSSYESSVIIISMTPHNYNSIFYQFITLQKHKFGVLKIFIWAISLFIHSNNGFLGYATSCKKVSFLEFPVFIDTDVYIYNYYLSIDDDVWRGCQFYKINVFCYWMWDFILHTNWYFGITHKLVFWYAVE